MTGNSGLFKGTIGDRISNGDDVTKVIHEQVKETEDQFIFETISPYCNHVAQKIVDKKELEKALLNFYGNRMTGNEYQSLAMRTNDGKCTDRVEHAINVFSDFQDVGLILNSSLGLSGEVGELNDMIKKWIFHQKELDKVHVKKEIGDILWYIAGMCEAFGFSLDDVMRMNIDKLKNRYPEGFDVVRANNRKEGDI